MFVQERIYDEFADRFIAAKAQEINLGQPLDPKTTMGPLVSSEQRERVLGYLELARDEGAKARSSAVSAAQDKGYFVKPTILHRREKPDAGSRARRSSARSPC